MITSRIYVYLSPSRRSIGYRRAEVARCVFSLTAPREPQWSTHVVGHGYNNMYQLAVL